MQKGQGLILVIVGVLVAVAIAAGAYYLEKQANPKPLPPSVVTSQTPQPTLSPIPGETVDPEATRSANWKIYTDDQYGFRFYYPSYLSVSVNELNYEVPSIKQIGLYNPNNKEKFDPDAIAMNILRNNINQSKESGDLKDGFSEDVGGNKLKRRVMEKEIIVGGKIGSEFTINYSYIETEEPVFLEYEFLIPLDQRTLVIHVYTANNKAKKTIDEVILPTFKFL